VKSLRLYADEDGESHFGETETTYSPVEYAPPAPAFEVSDRASATGYVAVRFPAGWDSEYHPTPRRQLLVMCSGELEGGTSDGTVVLLKAGDTVLMEDTTGKGHSAKVAGDEEVLALMIHLE
jgi:hypothetical protein